MTTDTTAPRPSLPRRFLIGGLTVVTLLVLWFGTMIGAMLMLDVSKQALVFGPTRQILNDQNDGIKIISLDEHRMVVTGTAPGYVRRLYAGGAWLVLPALTAGCLVLRR